MLLKLSCIILILNTFVSDCTSLSTHNNTFITDLIKSQYAELRSEMATMKLDQENMLNDIKSELALIRTDQKRKEKVLDELGRLVYGGNCAEAAAKTNQSGIYKVFIPSYSNKLFNVSCDMDTRGGNWTIILKRQDGSINFTRNWDAYKNGFGDIDGEFFLGLDKIHALTANGNQELLVLLEDFEGDKRYETYEEFAIGDEQELYALKTLGKANGTAGDELTYHYGQQFSTPDKGGCAKTYSACWWYNGCARSQLTGAYKDNTYGKGIMWIQFRGSKYSLKRAVMLIRPRKISV